MSSYLGALGSITVIVWILVLVRNHKIMLKFALPWLFLALFSFVFSLGSEARSLVTDLLGFEQPSNAFFAIAIVSLAFLGILLSIEVTSATDRLERASSAIALSRANVLSINEHLSEQPKSRNESSEEE
jgi:hypothetical protein